MSPALFPTNPLLIARLKMCMRVALWPPSPQALLLYSMRMVHFTPS